MKYLYIYALLLLSGVLALTACDEAVIDQNDIDGDGVPNARDVDDDNDGLIEISTLLELHNIRYNMRGTSYDDEEADVGTDADTGSTTGASATEPANCSDGNRRTVIPLCGYELTANLDFDTGNGSTRIQDTLDFDDHNEVYFPIRGTTDPELTAGSGYGGWDPIGDSTERFDAVFEGNGHTITNLAVSSSSDVAGNLEYFGLFGAVGANGYIRNVQLVNAFIVDVRNDNDRYYIGSIAGRLFGGIVSGCSSVATINSGMAVRGGRGRNGNVGGLIGRVDDGLVIASHVSGASESSRAVVEDSLENDARVGGLIGGQYGGRIAASYVINTEIRNRGSDSTIGGLVGEQDGGSDTIIVAAYAAVVFDVSTVGGNNIGGLLGTQSGSGIVSASYATGAISTDASTGAANNVGGLIGERDGISSAVAGSYTTGSVTGRNTDNVGNLVGKQTPDASGQTQTPVPDPAGSYGFGMITGLETSGFTATHPTAATAANLTAINTGVCTVAIPQPDPSMPPIEPNERNCEAQSGGRWASWNNLSAGPSDNTKPTGRNAWTFGGGSSPRLRYAEYDGDNSGIVYCDFFPSTVPGTSTSIVCGSTLLGGQ